MRTGSCAAIAEPLGATWELDHRIGAPPIVNDPWAVDRSCGRGRRGSSAASGVGADRAERRRRGLLLVPRPRAAARTPGSGSARPGRRWSTSTPAASTCDERAIAARRPAARWPARLVEAARPTLIRLDGPAPRDEHRRARLRPARARPSPRTPVEPRDAARLLVDRGPGRRRRPPHVRRPAGPRSAPATCSSSTTPGCSRPACSLRKATGGAVEVLLLERRRRRRRWEALVRPEPAGRRRARCSVARRPATLHGRGGRRPRRRPAAGRGSIDGGGRRPRRRSTRHGEVPLPAVHPRAARRPRALPDRLRPTGPARSPRPTAGLHLTAARARRAAGPRACEVAPVELVVGLGTFRPDRHRPGRGPPHARRALPRARRRRSTRVRARADAGRRRRHHGGAGARVGGRHRRARGPHRACSSTATRPVRAWSTRC